MSFQVNGTTGTPVDAMRITSAGNVGIGTVSPSAKLHINTGATLNAVFAKYETTGVGYGGIEFRGTRGTGSNGSTVGQIQSYWQNNARGGIIFNDGGDVAVIPTRNVGIGTTSPAYKLDVHGTSNVGALTATTGTFSGNLNVNSDNGTGSVGTWFSVDTSDSTYLKIGNGYSSADQLSLISAGDIAICCDHNNNSTGKNIDFRTNTSTNTGTLLMRVTDSGNVGVGTAKPQTKLNVHGTISTGRNLAREVGTVIAYSSQYQAARGAENVINGKKNYEDGSNVDWITASGQRTDAFVVIDLGASYAVDKFVIYNQNEYSNSMREVKGFKLQGSSDNSTWVDILVNECGRSNAHESNPGWSFRIPGNWDDDNEGTSYRYWKFIMNTFHGTNDYGGVTELELYEANDTIDDEVSTSSLVAQDVYSQTGNFSRGVAIGKGYGGTSTGENNLLVEGNVGIGTTNPIATLDIVGGAEDDTTPALSIRGGLYDTSDLYVLNTYNVATGIGYAAKVIGVNIKNKVETDNTIQVRNNSGGLTAAGAIYLGSDDLNQGIFGVLGAGGAVGTTLTERLTVRAGGNVGIGVTSPIAKLDSRSGVGNGTASWISGTFGGTGTYPRVVTGALSSVACVGAHNSALNAWEKIYLNDPSKPVVVDTSGRVGIGTTTPGCALAIYPSSYGSTSGSTQRTFFFWNQGNNTLALDNVNATTEIAIYTQGWIHSNRGIMASNGTLTASDTRIKKNIVDADDTECLETLRLLKPKKYQYKDAIARGEEPVWGFIAQEVRETLPYATDLRRDVLPNIYELANVSQSNVITFVNFNTSNLESNATTLIRTKGIDDKEHDLHLVEVIDEHTIRVEEDLSAWTGSVDAEGNVITQIETTTLTPEEYEALQDKSGYVANITGYQNANVVISIEEYNGLEDTTGYEEVIENYTKTTTIYPGTQLFVYGQEVDDFIFVKKEAIWTVATAALQEVDRQLQAEKTKVATLELQLASVLTRLDALESA